MNHYALIVDSDPLSASTYAALARAERLSPACVRDGTAALTQLLDRGAPGLLVVEAAAPQIDGFELIERLRRTAGGERTPVVVVSADRDLRERADGLRGRLGIGAVLAKAATGTSARRVIQKLLGETDARAATTKALPVPTGAGWAPEVAEVEDDELPKRSSWVVALEHHLEGPSTRRRSM
jgi:DNA-binding response OmpR family regulator